MVARYKVKRLAEGWSTDGDTKALNLEGSERNKGKLDAAHGVEDADWDQPEYINYELESELRLKKAMLCHQAEQDEPGYVCTCFED